MKHAGNDALDALEDLLRSVRQYTQLTEKKRGTFYRKSGAFLHFHEDPAGLFADLRVGDGWERLRVSTKAERKVMLARLDQTVDSPALPRRIASSRKGRSA